MRVKIFFFILAYLIFCVHLLNAQQYPFVQYTPKDGLANSRVANARQDSRGRLYFLTYNGLSVYDGARFTNYGAADGLGNNLVNDIYEAGEDSFLIASNCQIVNTLVKGKLGILKTGKENTLINHFLPDNQGNLYALGDYGLFKWDRSHFVRIPILDSLGRDLGRSLDQAVWYKNKLLLIPWEQNLGPHLILYDVVTGKVNDSYKDLELGVIAKNKKNEVWVTTTDGIRVVDTLALQRGKIVFHHLMGPFLSLKGWKPLSILFDRDNNCWANNEDTIQKIHSDGSREIFVDPQRIHTSQIRKCFIDREGILWVLTNGSGIYKLASSDIQIITSLNKNELFSYYTAIASDPDGKAVWLYNNTDHSIYSVNNNQLKRFPLKEKIYVNNIIAAPKKLYLVTSKTIYKVSNKNDPSAFLRLKKVYTLKQTDQFGQGILDSYGNIIIPVGGVGSFRIDAIIQENIIFPFPSRYFVDNMLIDRKGQLWVINRDRDLIVFTLHPSHPSQYLEEMHNFKKEVPCKYPRALALDNSNGLWIGSRDEGLFHLDLHNTHLILRRQLTIKDGLTDDFVCHLTSNLSNEIWACTQTGLDKIILKDGKYLIDNITKNNHIFQMMLYAVSDNRNKLFALCQGGNLITVKESKSDGLRTVPQLMVTELRVNNQPFDHFTKNPVFTYKNNSLSFFVAVPSFIDEKQIAYYYRLGGGPNNNWSEASHNPVFGFLNLPPGQYQLNMKASFPSGWYPTQFLNYSFSISPPWWQTWWFRFLTLVLLFLAGVRIVRSYVRRRLEKERILMEKSQAVEKERSRIATDMHDDLGAGLSRIKFLSETIGMKKQLQQPVEEDLTSIGGYATEMISKMGEIVWALNEKNDSISDLLAYSRSYAVEYLMENGISCKVNAPPDFPTGFVSGEFRRNVYLVIKESLHNIVKHAQASEVILDIHIDKKLHVLIRDNGIGFDRDHIRQFSNGLNNMQKRMEEIHGKLEIFSNNGTTVILSVPLPV